MNFRIRQKQSYTFVDENKYRKYTEMEVAIFEVVYVTDDMRPIYQHL